MTEAVVIGGGVAGSAAAIHLALLGRQVMLLDRARFPRRKACGEGLFPRGVRELRELGVLETLQGAAYIDRLRFHAYGEVAEAKLGDERSPALGVERNKLDAALLARARASGVDVQTGERALALIPEGEDRYLLLTDGGEIDAGAIVAADGLNSSFRRQAGLDPGKTGKRYGISGHVEWAGTASSAVEIYFCRGFEIYVTPVGEKLANVAILMSKPLTRLFAGQPSEAFTDILKREQCLGESWRLTDEPLAGGPFPARARGFWSRNLVLAGDAAGFFDGITGEGMSLALVSGRYCAEAVDEFMRTSSEEPFRRYEARRRALARNSELLGRLTLALSMTRWTARRAVRSLNLHPDAFSRLVAVSNGEAGLRSLRPADLLGLLR